MSNYPSKISDVRLNSHFGEDKIISPDAILPLGKLLSEEVEPRSPISGTTSNATGTTTINPANGQTMLDADVTVDF